VTDLFTPENDKTHMLNADFLNTSPVAAPVIDDLEVTGPARFFNRELSWLAFNWRVLEEAQNPSVPLLERVRFLSISGSNLDEFYTVRVAGLRELVSKGYTRPAQDGMTPAEQLVRIHDNARRLIQTQQHCWAELRQLLETEGIDLLVRDELTDADRRYLETVFMDQIFPILSPLAVDPAHPFPFIPNEGLSLALNLQRDKDKRKLRALLPIPQQVARILDLPANNTDTDRLIMLEEVLLEFIGHLFPGYSLKGHCSFRVLRDSDLEVEEEAEDLVREFETALKRRRRGEVIRLSLSHGAPQDLRRMILNSLHVMEEEVIEIEGVLGIADLGALIVDNRKDLLWPVFTPRMPERVQDFEGDIFAAIRQKDMLLHHPYETFDIVARFLQQAARDPDVVAIKQTLYRTSDQSPIVAALCEAAEDGKSVTALIELKARFDEAANIRQARRLERAGAHVVYGFIEWKTHAKISTVVRREDKDLVTYTHFGTGNYHPITAKVYTDLSLFTCNKSLGRDATRVFNYVSGYARPESLEYLSVSPIFLKKDLLASISGEVEAVKAGRKGAIWGKVNALIDADIIDAFYAASAQGVQIDLVVRGNCALRPGIAGLSENIRVKSIVGRFLEHSRIVCFGNGHGLPSSKARVYMSSADWMGRNLNRRVETLIEITNKTVHAQIMSQIMAANMADQANSWVLQPDGTYLRHKGVKGDRLFSCHRFFMENPSLSGRGSVGAKDVPKLTHSYDED
jgi:polyphosphate kinase